MTPHSPPKPKAHKLRKILCQIVAHPESWDQSWWLTKKACGTTGCFAGLTVLDAGVPVTWELADPDADPDVEENWAPELGGKYAEWDVNHAATDLLGLTLNQAEYLFSYRNDTPKRLAEAIEAIIAGRIS